MRGYLTNQENEIVYQTFHFKTRPSDRYMQLIGLVIQPVKDILNEKNLKNNFFIIKLYRSFNLN